MILKTFITFFFLYKMLNKTEEVNIIIIIIITSV